MPDAYAHYDVPLSPGHPHWPALRAGMASAHTDVTRHGGRPVALVLAPRDGWWLLGYAWASRTPVHLVELVLEATER